MLVAVVIKKSNFGVIKMKWKEFLVSSLKQNLIVIYLQFNKYLIGITLHPSGLFIAIAF